MADSNIRILAPERASVVPAVPGQKALAEVPKKAAGIEAPGGTLGPKQLAWCRDNLGSFDDAERRARQSIADTERMKREARS